MKQEHYRVLLVDDEPSFLKMMQKVIPWDVLGFDVVGTAGDGEAAMALIRETRPDVVITDIRMPVMDGLDLIRTCWEEIGTTIRFIIISGYDDFQYARKAIYYHVRNYLLKPLDVPELVRQMEQTAQELSVEKSMELERLQSAKSRVQATVMLLVSEEGQPPDNEETSFLTRLIQGGFHLMMILPEQETPDPDEQVLVGQSRWIQNILADWLTEAGTWLSFSDESDRLNLLLPVSLVKSRAVDLGSFMSSLSQELLRKGGIPSSLLSSECFERIDQLREAYEQVRSLVNLRLFEGRGLTRMYRSVDKLVPTYQLDGAVSPQQICDRIAEGDREGLSADLAGSFSYFSGHKVNLQLIIGYVHAIGYQLVHFVDGHHGNVAEWMNAGIPFPTYRKGMMLQDLQEELLKFCLHAIAYIRQLKSEGTTTVVDEVKGHMEAHFREPLSLRNMAQKFFINPTYLGYRFRAETGTGFTEYLQLLRMNETRRLLVETDEKVEMIAQQVGYRDKNYFTAVFKENVGMPPSQYRYRFRADRPRGSVP